MGIPAIVFGIRSKYDNTGVKAAKTGIKGLDSAVKGFEIKADSDIGKVIGSISKIAPQALAITAAVGAAVAVIGKVNQKIQECEKQFSDAEQGAVRLGIAVKNNANLGAGAVENLKKTAGELSLTSIYSQDDLIAQEAYLAGLGLTEDQIKKTLSAATELSAFNGDDLKTSVETLAKTYTGAEGKLGNLGTDFKNLTDEQLKNGAAIDLVNSKYKDFAKVISQDTLSGRESQWKKTADDIAQSVGSVFGTLKFSVLGAVQPVFDGLKDRISVFNTALINIFKNLPEVASLAAELVGEYFVTMLKPSTWINTIRALLTAVSKIFEDVWKGIAQLCIDIFNLAITNIKNLFVNLGLGIQAIFADAINVIIGAINKMIQGYNWAADKLGWKKGTEISKIATPTKETDAANSTKQYQSGLTTLLNNFGTTIKNIGTDVKEYAQDFSKPLADATKDTRKALADIVTKDTSISDAAAAVISPSGNVQITTGQTDVDSDTTTTTSTDLTTTGSTPETALSFGDQLEELLGGLSGITDMFGELGKSINLLIEGNPIGILAMVITTFVGAFASIENVGKSLNFISTICESMITVIEPLVNDIFEPLVVLFEDIGQILGTLLLPILTYVKDIFTPVFNVILTIMNALMPIINVVVQLLNILVSFTPLLNVLTVVASVLGNIITLIYNKILVPVVNGCIWIFTTCANFIIGIWNKMVDVLKSIDILGWKPFDGLSSKAQINYSDMALKEVSATTGSASTSTASSSTSGSSGASYTASRDIIQNFYISDSYVCGDAQKIALAIRAEIRNAEKLGY